MTLFKEICILKSEYTVNHAVDWPLKDGISKDKLHFALTFSDFIKLFKHGEKIAESICELILPLFKPNIKPDGRMEEGK